MSGRSTTTFTRRALLGAVALTACGTALAPSGAAAAAPVVARFREVLIDVEPFAARGMPNYSQRVAAKLRASVARVFAGRIAPNDRGAPTLVIQVSTVMLAAYSGGSSSGPFGGADEDGMTGALILRSPQGAIVDRRSHMATRDPGDAGEWRAADNEDRRLGLVCDMYAAWALKEYQ